MVGRTTNETDVGRRLEFELQYKKLVNHIHAATNVNGLMISVRDRILDVYKVEMATIFLADSSTKRLSSWVLLPGEYLRKIRIPIDNSSIAGFVAATGECLHIHDVYNPEELQAVSPDLQFDSSWDQKGGMQTRQVLAAPVKFKNALMGVIQLINKQDNEDFSDYDALHLRDLAETLGIALYNHHRIGTKIFQKFEDLVRRELITRAELDRACAIASQQNKDVETVLMENFKIGKIDLGQVLAGFYRTEYIDLRETHYDPEDLLKGVSLDYFRKVLLVPLQKDQGRILLATCDPADQSVIHEVSQVMRCSGVEVLFAFRTDIEWFIDRLKNRQGGTKTQHKQGSFDDIINKISEEVITAKVPERVEQTNIDDRPVVLLVRKIIEDAYKASASDIHIEPYGYKRDGEVRFRIDGACSHVRTIPKAYIKPVVARLKVMADLNISERRKPQDGKIKFRTTHGKDIELRVATLPTADGNEDVVLRILADSKPLPLDQIIPEYIYEKMLPIIKKPYGIFLVVGPTGSGKTTTLHSALNCINTPEKKIWTAEDPVEITQYRLRQVQIRTNIGLTFAAAMRAFLRADPDVIMIGEMRDNETAKMAIEASLTGHLVMSTLHTNSAPETIIRLIDMGIDPFNFADSLLGILAQRLVRTLCVKCKEAYNPSKKEYDHLMQNYGVMFMDNIRAFYSDSLTLYRAKGCPACNNTGYRGRAGLYELLVGSHGIKKLIIDRATVEDIRKEAINDGMTVLLQEGIHLIFNGQTDFNQVMSVCMQ
ncbi:MAG: hypothetical protein VR65_20495 [Desulfobulbaceae bacterium BRH_c16a]|nr:MAG: hypothetical protein VR65_20495 [Desulfobulbaceae bacterium BRH_c16a]